MFSLIDVCSIYTTENEDEDEEVVVMNLRINSPWFLPPLDRPTFIGSPSIDPEGFRFCFPDGNDNIPFHLNWWLADAPIPLSIKLRGRAEPERFNFTNVAVDIAVHRDGHERRCW